MNKLAVWGGLLAAVMAAPASAERVDFSVGSNSFRLALNGPLARIFGNAQGQYEIGALVRPKKSDDLLVSHVGATLTGQADFLTDLKLAAAVGLRAVYVGRDNEPGGALAAGGQVEARYPGFEKVGVSVYGYGAPDVTSIGHLNSYYEIGIGVDYQVIANASVYAGWREVKVDLQDAGKKNADHSAHLGVRLSF